MLRVARRDGSTASVTIRQAWDRGDIQAMTKNSPARATGAHVSIVGHITAEELRRELDVTDAANGFANRFLFVCARRSKALPEGGAMPEEQLQTLAVQVREALRFASVQPELRRDPSARNLWHEVYEELSDGKPGLVGAVTSRAEAQVMRIACVYALLDLSGQVRQEHLEAALSVWTYCAASARYIFGDATGDPVADEILQALRGSRRGMTRTEIRDIFGRHKIAAHIERGLATLERMGLARHSAVPTGGKPAERWAACAI